MNKSTILIWLPRMMTMALAGFLSIFSLDVFSEGLGFFKTIAALFMHLIPVWAVLIVLWASWTRPVIGAIIFPCLGIAYTFTSWKHWDAIALIALPMFLIGAAYFYNYWLTRKSPSV